MGGIKISEDWWAVIIGGIIMLGVYAGVLQNIVW